MSEYIIDWDENLVIDTFSKNSLREEIVRCCDCYFVNEIEGGYWCDRFDCGKEHVTPNGFCAWAKRRERESAEVWNQWSADDVTCSEES